jgi:hypothetical protein
MVVTNRPGAFPREMATVLGDYAQNLRAALDHIAYQVAFVNVGRLLTDEEAEATAFPIVASPNSLRSWHGMRGRTVLFPNALAQFERCQPYYGGRQPFTHEMWWLARLSNVDKHRLLLLMRPTARHRTVFLRSRGKGFKTARVINSKLGTKAWLEFPTGEQGDAMPMNTSTTTDVVLRDAEMAFIGNPMYALAKARRFIYRNVMPEFQGTIGKFPRVR